METTEGWQPRASGGERILVALAAVALVGAVLIVAGNLLRKDDAVSLASGSPLPTSTPSPTPVPSPTIMELVVGESTAPGSSPSPTPALFGGWIRASVDLPILDSASEGAAVIGTLPAGSLAYADEQDQGAAPGAWMTIEAPDPTGSVATRRNGTNLVERLVPAIVPYSGAFQTLAAGPSGFVAIASQYSSSSSYLPPSVFVSSDGVSWHAASGQPGHDLNPNGVAWGPKGWLMVANDPNSDRMRLWTSPDGERWMVLGALQAGYPQGLAGSSAGYLLSIEGGRDGNDQQVWFSADGMRWTRSNPGLPGYYQVTATTMGFYATTAACCEPQPAAMAAFSTDGLTWSPNLPKLFVAAVDGILLGIQAAPNGRGGHPLHGSFYHGQVRWRPVQDGDAPFAGALVTSIASDGQRATAFGWDPNTEASFTWTSDGGPWTRHALPTTFGGPPSAAAAANGRVIVVGNRWTPRGNNPVVWHEGADGGWAPEPAPVLGFAPEPSTADCGPPPRDALELLNGDRAMAVACLGNAPFTIRAWSSRCDGCFGTPDGTYDEPWLSSPSSNLLSLSPVKWLDQWSMNGVLSPTLRPSPDRAWVNHWLELTGHFDDSASTRCHWNPPPDQLQYYGGARPVIEQCREQFVVTAVRVVEGP